LGFRPSRCPLRVTKADRVKQIYIADDNKDFADTIADVAEREGWDVKTCTNGLELLDAVKSSDGPGLLLVDVNMPEMDGIEVIKSLVHVQRPLRIHFMTGGRAPLLMLRKPLQRDTV